MKAKQATLAPIDKIKVSDKNIIKQGSLKFYPVDDKSFEGVMKELEEVHHRTKHYALFSGGKDSMTVTHKLAEMGKLEKVVHIKTNIGLQMTEDFVRDICQEYGWPLEMIEPNPKFTYAAHVLQYGFPGPEFHRYIMGKLKFKTMRDFALSADSVRNDKEFHSLVCGIRKFESVRRMGNYPEPIQAAGKLWFVSPVFYMTNKEVQKYVLVNDLKISPAYKAGLGTSGECMCGSYAGHDEKALIKRLDPKLANYIEWLEDGIQKFGKPNAKRYGKWGKSAKMSDMEQQTQMDLFTKENPTLSNLESFEALTCGSECGPGTMRGMVDY